MGTTYTVRIVSAPPDVSAHRIRTVIDEELEKVDLAMSTYRTDSEISRLNAAPSSEWIPASAELATVLNAALQVGGESQGAFDVTIAPLVDLWGFGPLAPEGAPMPKESDIERARAAAGLHRLEVRIHPPAIRKHSGDVRIDLNAIAPGYAVDRIAARLDGLGIRNYLVDIGGEIRTRGTNREREPWRVAVERPKEGAPTPFAVLGITDKAVATSGGYRNYVESNGRRLSHTIDPRSGRPILAQAASVVVIHEEAMFADAWATALSVLGPKDGHALATERGMAVMFVVENGDSLAAKMTPAFEPFLIERAQ